MSKRATARPKARALERGDRVLLPDGATAALVLTADAEGNALVRRERAENPAERYEVVPAAQLVRG